LKLLNAISAPPQGIRFKELPIVTAVPFDGNAICVTNRDDCSKSLIGWINGFWIFEVELV
jgi:hypothetical protein